jgi:extradiol dioxygenase family protein
MLGDNDAVATVPVKDLDRARRFYGETLGLEEIPGEEMVLSYRCGGSSILVYVSEYAGTNSATAVTWMIGDDVDGVVRSLRERGIVFEHYDIPGARRDGEVHVIGDIRNAWFKDPDGNIHSVVGR